MKSEFKQIKFRDLKSIDVNEFQKEIIDTLDASTSTTFGGKISFYNEKLSELLNKHAPLKDKSIKIVPNSPWFDNDYKILRRERRKAEKKFKNLKGLRIKKNSLCCGKKQLSWLLQKSENIL